MVSRHIAMEGEDRNKLSVEETLYLATRGGAKVTGLDRKVGGFEIGMEWDAQLIGLGHGDRDEDALPVDIFGWEDWHEKVEKWVFGGDDRNIKRVYVQGKLVGGTEFHG